MSTTQTMQASTFKAQCLALLDEVENTHVSIVITKYGKPVARLVPIDDQRSTLGSVTLLTDLEGDLFSTGEAWDVD